ncbi:MAG TPA: response regulator transcription factor, partial [Calditrichaeota bacterium]|nr:response regulator transcription factor [Calditrichota bacterium]
TIYEDEDNIFRALCNGADGYLLKNTPPAHLIECIYDASNGGSPMSSLIARKVVSFFKTYPMSQKEKTNLSSRELEILNNLAQGNSYKIIAKRLFISTDTVRYHIRNIYRKLQVHSQSEAVAKALKKGWI